MKWGSNEYDIEATKQTTTINININYRKRTLSEKWMYWLWIPLDGWIQKGFIEFIWTEWNNTKSKKNNTANNDLEITSR